MAIDNFDVFLLVMFKDFFFSPSSSMSEIHIYTDVYSGNHGNTKPNDMRTYHQDTEERIVGSRDVRKI